jgi:hypothetical protein
MLENKQAGFPARGNTLYVFSIDGISNGSGAGMLTTGATSGASNKVPG